MSDHLIKEKILRAIGTPQLGWMNARNRIVITLKFRMSALTKQCAREITYHLNGIPEMHRLTPDEKKENDYVECGDKYMFSTNVVFGDFGNLLML